MSVFKACSTCALCCNNITQTALEKSYTPVIKFFAIVIETQLYGPQRSKSIISKISFVCIELEPKGIQRCFAKIQTIQSLFIQEASILSI